MNDNTVIWVIICLLIGILFGGLVGIFQDIQYKYELKKCSNLDSHASNYDFDLKIEKNAEYNEDCYELENHPLAYFIWVIFPSFLTFMMLFIFSLLLGWLLKEISSL